MGKVIFDSDPKTLVEKVIEQIKADEKEIKPHDYEVSAHRAGG